MRIAYGDNYIQEVKRVQVTNYYLFVDGDTYEMDDDREAKEIFESLLKNGYADIRGKDRT